MTLSKHIQALADERAMWLRQPPADLPAWAREMVTAARGSRLAQAAAVEAEINDAIVLMRRLGFLPGRGEMRESEQPAGESPEGDAAQP